MIRTRNIPSMKAPLVSTDASAPWQMRTSHAAMRNRPASIHGRGFTLPEVLIVVTIIIVLAALMFPTTTRIREQAKRTKCMSNVRQLGVAAMGYAAEHNNTLFVPVPLTTVAFVGKGTNGIPINDPRRFLNPYVGGPFSTGQDVDIARCPSDQGGTGGATTLLYDQMGTSYMLNYRSPASNAPTLRTDNSGTPFPLARVKKPERTIMIACHPAFNYADGGNRRQKWHKGQKSDGVYVNVCFVGGNAAFVEIPRAGSTANYPDSPDFSWGIQ
jgi:prepilin-type N-terminal cleavage/methylation domain-containing protein